MFFIFEIHDGDGVSGKCSVGLIVRNWLSEEVVLRYHFPLTYFLPSVLFSNISVLPMNAGSVPLIRTI